MALRGLTGLILATTLGWGCATGDGMQSKLRDATRGYNRHLRWGDHGRAAEYVPPSARTAFLRMREQIDGDLVVVDYQVTRLQIDKEKGVATSRAQILWHTDRRLIVEETVVEQLWQWYEGGWILVDERRASGTPLAVFAEPEEQPHPYLPGLTVFRQRHEIGQENRDRNR